MSTPAVTGGLVAITHKIPAPIVLLTTETVARVQRVIDAANAIETVQSVDDCAHAEAVLVGLHELGKSIESERAALKAPILAVGKALDEAARVATEPLSTLKRSLQGKLAKWHDDQARIAEERRRVAQAEADRQAAEQRRIADEARKAEEARTAELAASMDLEPADLLPPKPPEPPPPPTVYVPPPPRSTATVTKTVRVLEIHDRAAVPCVVGGVELRPIDEAAVKRLLAAGVGVPGCRMVEQQQTAMRPNRFGESIR